MSLYYITEAFKSLELLNEDVFDTTPAGIDDLKSFIDADADAEEIRVIDPEAESEEDIKDSYIGKVILNCNVCHECMFKAKEDLAIDAEGIVNSEEECPRCGSMDGYTIVGEIHEFAPESEEEVEETPVEETEETSELIEESLDLDAAIASRFTRDQLQKLSPEEIKILKSHDREAIQAIIDKYTIEESLQEESNMAKLRRRFPELNNVTEQLDEAFKNVSLETEDQIMTMTSEDNGKVTVTTEPVVTESAVEGESIVPVSDETQNEIIDIAAETEEVPEEDTDMLPEEEDVDFDFDEIVEESFDTVGESYLKRVYENVNSFKTTSVSTTPTQLIVEGVINFNSGVKKNTGFIFEAKDATKNGKVRFTGENAHICRGKKAFTLTGSVKEGKLLAESFTYNYRAKNSDGKSVRVYGTVSNKK